MAPARGNALRARYARAKTAAQGAELAAKRSAKAHGEQNLKAGLAKFNQHKKESGYLEARCQRLLTLISKAKRAGNAKRAKQLETEYMRSERRFNELAFKNELLAEELAEALRE